MFHHKIWHSHNRKSVSIKTGIALNYDYGFEAHQASLAMCYSIASWLINCSDFFNEDLPSNYLGILSAVKPDLTLDFIIKELGRGEQFEDNEGFPTDEYWGNSWPLLELTNTVIVPLIIHLIISVTSRYMMPVPANLHTSLGRNR